MKEQTQNLESDLEQVPGAEPQERKTKQDKKPKQAQKPEINFEEAMNQLEDIVSQLERGDVPLEKAIELFQQGMQLSQLCSQKLTQVERKIETIVEQDGQLGKKPFEPPMEENGEYAG